MKPTSFSSSISANLGNPGEVHKYILRFIRTGVFGEFGEFGVFGVCVS